MKRFHVNVTVADVGRSVDFYNTLFGAEATVVKDDYAKWMLDDPRINFSISAGNGKRGINHIGLQADDIEELAAIQSRLDAAGQVTLDQPAAECCYAKSTKSWVRDPDDVAWEAFVTHGEIAHYGGDRAPERSNASTSADRCC